jgi:hypothetical protein
LSVAVIGSVVLEAMELTFLPIFEGTRTEGGGRYGREDLHDQITLT